jgi:hypothetical protein
MAFSTLAYSQAEVMPWGNITGIRKSGQLFEFESSLKMIPVDGQRTVSTAKEHQTPHFSRNGNDQVVETNFNNLFFKEIVTDVSNGEIKVSLEISARTDTAITGIYFCIALPIENYTSGQFRLASVSDNSQKNFAGAEKQDYKQLIKGIEFKSSTRKLEVQFDEPAFVMIKRDGGLDRNNLQLYVSLTPNSLHKGDVVQKSFTIKTNGSIDKAPISLAINTRLQGRPFSGLGGNFRLQNPKTDPQVIDYSLKNMRVAYGRVEMPWRFWQPGKDINPTASADSGKLHPAVKKAMEMAHRLDSMGIPVILSAWFPPDWAVVGKPNPRPVNGVWGNPLNHDNMQAIYSSIADYIFYLKNKYGMEVKLFSFNESDLGINIRLTAQEHDDFIKGCGAYFVSRGLKTKMLLGDNSDATTYKFIYPAMNDPEAKQYIGAISFHSWRGWGTDILQKWADAASQLNVPLIVGEGSTDADAYKYPDIFQEQTYALQEINLYARILAICQPLSILQWQLTADYSPLIGGGIFGNDEPLHPGQRFYNLKQLSLTPIGLFAIPITCDRPNVSCAAFGDSGKGTYAVNLVNNGTSREVTLTGLPGNVRSLSIYNTGAKLGAKQGRSVKVVNGKAKFKLEETSFTTLISE